MPDALRARGEVGAAQLGDQPPAARSRPRSTTASSTRSYGYWGFSPSNIPEGGYDAYGVDAIGLNPDGYPSNEDHTFVDHGFAGCPGPRPSPIRRPSATRTAS